MNGDGKCDDCGATVSLTVTWDAGSNGGTINGKASFSETVKPNSVPAAPSASPVKTGHTFKNWYTEKTGGKLYTTVTAITASQTFYAQFEANKYVVTWNLGDGRSETTEQIYGEKLVLPTEPTRKNAEFLGWFTEKDGGTEVTANTVFKETAATTYYAHWEVTELFSVTVPATLPLVVDETGKVYVAAASIVNNSTGDVMVSSVSVTSKTVGSSCRIRPIWQRPRWTPSRSASRSILPKPARPAILRSSRWLRRGRSKKQTRSPSTMMPSYPPFLSL